ncbi:MAG: leucine-rich repeat domain-containing protein [Muribaculaceae bacterium]|nr:leucine-rich repeat domain-containing protein [Muribaculaceae bacterium]
MIKKYSLLLYAIALTVMPSAAISVVGSAGELRNIITDYANVSELSLSGTVDATDLFFIAEVLPSLRTLDMRECTIVAYVGNEVGQLTSYGNNAIPQSVFAGTALEEVLLPVAGAIEIGDCAFAGTALKSIEIPANTVAVGQGAFSGCPFLTSVKIGKYKSGGYIFSNCPALSTADVTGATSIGIADFALCTALTNVKGSENLEEIGTEAFNACLSLSNFNFGEKIHAIGESAFAYTALSKVDLSSTSITHIGGWCFAGCAALSSVKLPKTATELGKGAFFDCSSLSTVSLPTDIDTINDYTLKGTSIKGINIPEGVTTIGRLAMAGASQTSTVGLPSSLTYIDDNAMEGMTGLKTIYAASLPEVPQLGSDVWAGVDQASVRLEVNENIASLYEEAAQWQDFDIVPSDPDSGITDPASTPALRACIVGETLIVEATDTIKSLELFNASGALLLRKSIAGTSVQTNISDFNTRIFLVRCILDNGTVATLKLGR